MKVPQQICNHNKVKQTTFRSNFRLAKKCEKSSITLEKQRRGESSHRKDKHYVLEEIAHMKIIVRP